MKHFKFVNWWIRSFVFWCHEPVTTRLISICKKNSKFVKSCGEQIIQFQTEVDKYLLLYKWNDTKEKNLIQLESNFCRGLNFRGQPIQLTSREFNPNGLYMLNAPLTKLTMVSNYFYRSFLTFIFLRFHEIIWVPILALVIKATLSTANSIQGS